MLRPERDLTGVRKARVASSERQKVTLSCEQCRQRKTRCDKAHPCGSCQRSHLDCTIVHRQRLPRGRVGPENNRDGGLKDRVARLENLITGLQSKGHTRAEHPERLRQKASTVPIENGHSKNNGDVDGSFWVTLNDQVAGIRETLEEFPDEESDDAYQSPLPSVANHSSPELDLILFGASSCVVNPTLLEAPPSSILKALVETYIYQVDPVFKVVHVPSLRGALLNEEQHLVEPLSRPACDALKFAIFFTAVCTLTESESRNLLSEEKSRTVDRFRLATEVMLSRANLHATSDITVLQAFVIYLAGCRTCTGYKKIWALIATAVRIGQSLGLDTEEGRFRTSFQTEIRRRLWYSIGILDMQAAFDGGSHSVIASNGVLGHRPLNINDAAMSPNSNHFSYIEKPGFTDMSHNSMMHEALICWRRLTHVPTNPEGQAVKVRQEWSDRAKIVNDWVQRIQEKYLRFCDSAQPFHRFMKFVGQDMIITMRLLERRPMHRLVSAGPPPADDFNVLKIATDVCERSLVKFTDPNFAPWSWFAWVKWYVLAVILAELCGRGNGPLTDRAWRVAEEAFPKFADLVIDDILWRSVARLKQKARSTRDGSRGLPLPIPAPLSPRTTPPYRGSSYDGLRKDDIQSRDSKRYSNVDLRACDRFSQSSHQSEPSTEKGQSRMDLSPAYMDNNAHNASVDEAEYMSWINWELFVQDVGSFDEQHAPDVTSPVSHNMN